MFIVNLLQWYVAPLFGSIWLKIKKKRSLANTSHLAVSCSSINSTFSSKLDVLHTPIFGSEILSMVWTQNIVFVAHYVINWLLVFCCATLKPSSIAPFFVCMVYLHVVFEHLPQSTDRWFQSITKACIFGKHESPLTKTNKISPTTTQIWMWTNKNRNVNHKKTNVQIGDLNPKKNPAR